jgi:ubiquinone/menaquinone biosynthesis C-methylase UbiE
MVKIESFEKYHKEYDKWFIKNQNIYIAEVDAIKRFVPHFDFGVEIGVGTGRFSLPLGIKVGVEPSKKMGEISRNRGIQVYKGVAEQLPFIDATFDFALMVTTICFVDDLEKSFKEAYRILKTDGFIIVGFVDKESDLGKNYQLTRKKSKFYKYAIFYSTKEVINFLKKTNFENPIIRKTVFPIKNDEINSLDNGYSKRGFVIIKAVKRLN